MNSKLRGFVSIFLCLIILPLYSFSLLTIDVARIVSGKNEAKILGESLIDSIMSNYNRELYDKYNILGISENKDYIEKYTRELIFEYEKNNKSKFYNSKLNINILLDNKSKLINLYNFEKQILDYMRLQGPYKLGNGIKNLIKVTYDSKKYNNVLQKKFDFEKEYSKLHTNISNLSDNLYKYTLNFENINKKINLLNEKIDKIDKNKNINNLKLDISNLLKLIKDNLIILNKSIPILQKMSKETVNIQNKLDSWKNSIKKLDNSSVKNNLNSDYELAKLEINKENIDDILSKILEIRSIYEKNINKLVKFNSKTLDKSLKIDIIPNLKDFKLYKFLIGQRTSKPLGIMSKTEAKSNKKRIENIVKNLKIDSNIEKEKNIEDYISLDRISKFINNSREDLGKINYSEDVGEILKQSDNIININSKNLLNNLYLASYIVDKFDNKLSETDNFKSQIEYILYGNNKLTKNNKNIEKSIFAIRFLLNAIYAYTNATLGREATVLATAIAGWTGFGVPIVKSIILASMTFGESLVDVNSINNKKYVEIFKNNKTWQISLKSLPKILVKKTEEILSNSIDNFYDIVENFSIKKIENFKENMKELTKQSIDGLSQQIISEIITPVQTIVSKYINEPISIFKSRINQVFDSINISGANSEINSIKKYLVRYIRNKVMSELSKIKGVNFEQYFRNLVSEVEDYINSKYSKLSEDLIDKTSNLLMNNKQKNKAKVKQLIEKYMSKISGEHIKNSSLIKNGLSFNYKDYLLLLTFLNLNSNKKSSILNRALLVIDYEMKKYDKNFLIENVITKFSLNLDLNVRTLFLNKYIRIKKLEEEVYGGY